MDSIKRNSVVLRYSEKAFIYKPIKRTIIGELDGKEYSVVVREPELPAGTAAGPPQNVQVLAWDNAFYVYWELPQGPVDSFEIVMLDSLDNEIATATDIPASQQYFKFVESTTDYITNGEEYSFTVGARVQDILDNAPEVLGTASDKVPKNLVVTERRDTNGTITWDAVAEASSYVTYLYNTGTGEELQSVEVGTNSVQFFGLIKGSQYDVKVKSVNSLSGFESGLSNAVTFIATDKPSAPANYNVQVVSTEGQMSWDSVADIAGYNVYVSEDGGSYIKENNSLITGTSYTKTGLVEGVTYDGYVVAVRGDLESDPSNIVEFAIPTLPEYRYYRIKMFAMEYPGRFAISTQEIELRAVVGGPDLATDAVLGDPRVEESNPNYGRGYLAFNGAISGSEFRQPDDAIPGGWVSFDFGDAQQIAEYGIYGNDAGTTSGIKEWRLQGSDDHSTWEDIDHQTNQTGWSPGELRLFQL